ncbi:MAG: hypothetical protein ACKV22_35430 [Bryobacteraceae bacterium]
MLFTYVYLMRVPVLCGLLLAAFPLLALKSGARGLLIGMYDLQFWRAAVVTLLTIVLAASVAITMDLVLKGARTRFDAPPLPPWFHLTRRIGGNQFDNSTLVVIVFAMLCALANLAGLIAGLKITGHSEAIWSVPVTALATSAVCLVAALRWWRSPKHPRIDRVVIRLVYWTRQGYFDRRNPYLLRGHSGALVAMAATFALYGVFGLAKYFSMIEVIRPRSDNNPIVPTLGCVILLINVICWSFSALAFFGDRFRFPLLIVVAMIVGYSGTWVESRHTYRVSKIAWEPDLLLPAELARVHPERPVILVAAAGGGIQATAWTGHVLGGLLRDLEATRGLGRQFSESIRVISSVSGGSVGAMYFVRAYQNGFVAPSLVEAEVLAASTHSSLDEIAWGLAYPDVIRVLFPGLPWSDRGWAAEYAWRQAVGGVDLTEPLRSWRSEVRSGDRPAVLFNATLVGSGARLVMGTADFALDTPGRRSFYRLYAERGYDLPIVTAARLSATFPYVSPAAQAEPPPADPALPKRLQYHAVDGGYYDLYGMATLTDWLEDALPGLEGRRVMLIQIRGPLPGEAVGEGGRGFFFQLAAPFSTLLHMRGASQIDHNNNRLRTLLAVGRAQRVRFAEPVVFEWPEDSNDPAPLSWHLTSPQTRRIRQRFAEGYTAQKAEIAAFLEESER